MKFISAFFFVDRQIVREMNLKYFHMCPVLNAHACKINDMFRTLFKYEPRKYANIVIETTNTNYYWNKYAEMRWWFSFLLFIFFLFCYIYSKVIQKVQITHQRFWVWMHVCVYVRNLLFIDRWFSFPFKLFCSLFAH